MIYQLIGEFDLGDKILVDPFWELELQLNSDYRKDKKKVVSIELWTPTAGRFHRTVGIYDYSAEGTWEDADLEDYVLTLPDYAISVRIDDSLQ